MMSKNLIAVIGGRHEGKPLLKEAEALGRLIAKKGFILITGGLSGVMRAVSKGAHSHGGITVGILPQEHKGSANEYVSIPIATGIGIARNAIIARTADAVIAIGGEYGTLSEIAFALQMGKPVIGIKTWDIKGVIKAKDAKEAVSNVMKLLS
ncbi:MAG: TIGR00725 family protein [Nitrospirae bacterium]|nr:TIGR00725 family protein [Nitrospirota bacterium]